MVPFNKPHGLKVIEILPDGIEVFWPYKKSNLNHIKGLHACGLATLAEFATGFSLLRKLDPKKYRLIMKSISMEYHYQGKFHAKAVFKVDQEWLTKQILNPIKEKGVTNVDCLIDIYDIKDNHLATGTINWQVKSWDQVKTKV